MGWRLPRCIAWTANCLSAWPAVIWEYPLCLWRLAHILQQRAGERRWTTLYLPVWSSSKLQQLQLPKSVSRAGVKHTVPVLSRVTQTRSFDTEAASSSYATGFVVDKVRGLILTNRHVLTPGELPCQMLYWTELCCTCGAQHVLHYLTAIEMQ